MKCVIYTIHYAHSRIVVINSLFEYSDILGLPSSIPIQNLLDIVTISGFGMQFSLFMFFKKVKIELYFHCLQPNNTVDVRYNVLLAFERR